MKTRTITEVAAKPVEVISADYALQEYGLKPAKMDAAAKRISRELKSAARAGDVISFRGDGLDFD